MESANDFIIDMTAFILSESEMKNIKEIENLPIIGKFIIIIVSRE